jgi:hypothetical protein
MKPITITKDQAIELWGTDFMERFSKADVSDPLRGPRDEPDSKKVSEQLLEAVNNMLVHNPNLNPVHAARWLMTTPQGQNFLSQHKTERNIPMQVDINKLHNIDSVTEIAKNVIDDKVVLTEHQFYEVLTGHAKLAGTTLEKLLTDPNNGEIRQAYRISKGQAQMEA